MCKTLKVLSITILLSACFIVSAAAKEEVTEINTLVENTKAYDQQVVTIQGEAIGEVLERGEYSWVNISDGTNAIGIWMKTTDADTIKYFGDYKNIGDTVKVTGVFSRDCTEHGGDVDIHCASYEIVKEGSVVISKISHSKALTAAILLISAALATFFYNKVIRKKK